jgi:protein-disulfide isomerase
MARLYTNRKLRLRRMHLTTAEVCTNVPGMDRRLCRLYLSAALLGLPACKGTDAAPAPGAAADANDTPTTPTTPADPASCETWSSQMCEKAGEGSATCGSVRETAAILPPAACAAAIAEIGYSTAKLAEASKTCDELVAKLCGDLGAETDTCKMVTAKTKELPADQCEGMMKEYPQVLAELQAMEAANKPLDEAQAKSISDGDHPAFGPEDSKVTIVEFSDFQCPYCSRAAEAVGQIKEKYSDKARFVFRQFPLSFHKDAHLAAQASLAAHAQGKFWPFHDLLFENQEALGREQLEGYAKKAGLDMSKFKAALDNKSYAQQVDDDLALGKTVFVQGTPTIFVNGQRVQNATDFAAISAMIDGELAKAG